MPPLALSNQAFRLPLLYIEANICFLFRLYASTQMYFWVESKLVTTGNKNTLLIYFEIIPCFLFWLTKLSSEIYFWSVKCKTNLSLFISLYLYIYVFRLYIFGNVVNNFNSFGVSDDVGFYLLKTIIPTFWLILRCIHFLPW